IASLGTEFDDGLAHAALVSGVWTHQPDRCEGHGCLLERNANPRHGQAGAVSGGIVWPARAGGKGRLHGKGRSGDNRGGSYRGQGLPSSCATRRQRSASRWISRRACPPRPCHPETERRTNVHAPGVLSAADEIASAGAARWGDTAI